MSKYDELRKQRLSQSMIFDPEDPPSLSMRSSLRIEEKPSYDTERTSDDNLLYAPLVPILEYQKVRPPTKPAPQVTSKSMMDSKFNKDKMQAPSSKLMEVERGKEEVKAKEERREKANALRVKTKQLR